MVYFDIFKHTATNIKIKKRGFAGDIATQHPYILKGAFSSEK